MEGILLSFILEEKIRIGISAHIYESKVKFDSKGYEAIGYLDREKSNYIWVPVSLEDMIEPLKNKNIDAYIFMEESSNLKEKRSESSSEVFFIPAQDLQNPVKWWDWRRRLSAFVWLKYHPITNLKELYDAWHILKFLCQEVDEKFARSLGKEIAMFKKEHPLEILKGIRQDILNTLRKSSELKNVKQWLWKNYIFLKKHERIKLEAVCPPEIYRDMTSIVDEMIAVEGEVRDTNTLFGTSPIIYSPRR